MMVGRGVLATLAMLLVAAPGAAVLGKQGFDYLKRGIKQAFGRFFRKRGPPETVSRMRYRIGLVMFAAPIVLGWITPYALHHLQGYERYDRIPKRNPSEDLTAIRTSVPAGWIQIAASHWRWQQTAR